MELLERYVHQVGRFLPRRDREDIQDELRSLLLDRLEGAHQLDRVTGEPEEEALVDLLKEVGHPRDVAASYGAERHLIGPTLYPLFTQVVRIGAIVLVAVHLVLLVLGAVTGTIPNLVEFTFDAIGNTLGYFGAVVIVFAILERQDVKINLEEEDWNPRDLPEIDKPARVETVGHFVGIAFNLVVIAVCLVGWRVGGVPVVANPWAETTIIPLSRGLLLAAAGLTAVQVVIALYVFLRRRWQLWTIIVNAVADAATALPIFLLIIQAVETPLGSFEPLEVLMPMMRTAFTLGMVAVVAINLIEGGVKSYKLLRRG